MTLWQFKVIQHHEVKEVKFKILSLGELYMFLVRFSATTQKTTPEHFLNGPNRTKIENRKNAEILVNSVKSGRFGHSERQNSAVFKDSDLNVCTHILQQVFYTYIAVFWKLKILENFGKQNILMTIFTNFQKFQNMRPQFDSHVQSACCAENQVALSLKLYSWRWFPRTLIFDRNRENMTSIWRQ